MMLGKRGHAYEPNIFTEDIVENNDGKIIDANNTKRLKMDEVNKKNVNYIQDYSMAIDALNQNQSSSHEKNDAQYWGDRLGDTGATFNYETLQPHVSSSSALIMAESESVYSESRTQRRKSRRLANLSAVEEVSIGQSERMSVNGKGNDEIASVYSASDINDHNNMVSQKNLQRYNSFETPGKLEKSWRHDPHDGRLFSTYNPHDGHDQSRSEEGGSSVIHTRSTSSHSIATYLDWSNASSVSIHDRKETVHKTVRDTVHETVNGDHTPKLPRRRRISKQSNTSSTAHRHKAINLIETIPEGTVEEPSTVSSTVLLNGVRLVRLMLAAAVMIGLIGLLWIYRPYLQGSWSMGRHPHGNTTRSEGLDHSDVPKDSLLTKFSEVQEAFDSLRSSVDQLERDWRVPTGSIVGDKEEKPSGLLLSQRVRVLINSSMDTWDEWMTSKEIHAIHERQFLDQMDQSSTQFQELMDQIHEVKKKKSDWLDSLQSGQTMQRIEDGQLGLDAASVRDEIAAMNASVVALEMTITNGLLESLNDLLTVINHSQSFSLEWIASHRSSPSNHSMGEDGSRSQFLQHQQRLLEVAESLMEVIQSHQVVRQQSVGRHHNQSSEGTAIEMVTEDSVQLLHEVANLMEQLTKYSDDAKLELKKGRGQSPPSVPRSELEPLDEMTIIESLDMMKKSSEDKWTALRMAMKDRIDEMLLSLHPSSSETPAAPNTALDDWSVPHFFNGTGTGLEGNGSMPSANPVTEYFVDYATAPRGGKVARPNSYSLSSLTSDTTATTSTTAMDRKESYVQWPYLLTSKPYRNSTSIQLNLSFAAVSKLLRVGSDRAGKTMNSMVHHFLLNLPIRRPNNASLASEAPSTATEPPGVSDDPLAMIGKPPSDADSMDEDEAPTELELINEMDCLQVDASEVISYYEPLYGQCYPLPLSDSSSNHPSPDSRHPIPNPTESLSSMPPHIARITIVFHSLVDVKEIQLVHVLRLHAIRNSSTYRTTSLGHAAPHTFYVTGWSRDPTRHRVTPRYDANGQLRPVSVQPFRGRNPLFGREGKKSLLKYHYNLGLFSFIAPELSEKRDWNQMSEGQNETVVSNQNVTIVKQSNEEGMVQLKVVQSFQIAPQDLLTNEPLPPLKAVTIEVLSNHGHPDMTCFYRIKVLGMLR